MRRAALLLIAAVPGPALAEDADDLKFRVTSAPEISTDNGWRLKLRGRVNYDTTYISTPRGVAADDLGTASQFRRIRFGVEGDTPGGIAYKAELEFARGRARAVDFAFSYRASKTAPILLTVGHLEPLNGFEQISSSRYTSTIERGAYNEAFTNTRRLGVYATYVSPDDAVRIAAGVFGDTMNAEKTNNDLTIATRAYWVRKVGAARLHVGVNARRRTFRADRAPLSYRVRPQINLTDARFVNTGRLAVPSDFIFGGEVLAIAGPFHAILEGQKLIAHVARPGSGGAALGRRTGFDPGLFGYTAEVGWFFTGESRGYRDGLWAITRPLHPVDKGGIGAVSLNLRYDHLDLDDRGADGEAVRGGVQDTYVAALVWQPTDHTRLTFQYAHGDVEGGPLAAQAGPEFAFDMAGMRLSFDF